ncbi:MAG: hypothetical protein Ct9H90mP16_14770 [Candidatus Poseidoniales archaeon]|nr:MAG: hypothetical protein Ct9H90mP16_14770 [Candidatus Poseidoniales archaeon]
MNWALSAFMRGVVDSVRWWHVLILGIALVSILVDYILRLK